MGPTDGIDNGSMASREGGTVFWIQTHFKLPRDDDLALKQTSN